MEDIVYSNQSAFIKGRCLHDNFLLLGKWPETLTRHTQKKKNLNARKISAVLLKLDIARAFDSLSWPFLFEVLRAKCFSQRWMVWIQFLLSSASTKVIVNGTPGPKFFHAKVVRQGDPISPLLLLIVMDILTMLLAKAADLGVLSRLPGVSDLQRTSIFADYVVLFVKPMELDFSVSFTRPLTGLVLLPNYRSTATIFAKKKKSTTTRPLRCPS